MVVYMCVFNTRGAVLCSQHDTGLPDDFQARGRDVPSYVLRLFSCSDLNL